MLGLLGGVVGGPILRVGLLGYGSLLGRKGNPHREGEVLDKTENVFARALSVGEVRAVTSEIGPIQSDAVGATGGLGTDLVEAGSKGGDCLRLASKKGAAEEAPVRHRSRRTARTRLPTQW